MTPAVERTTARRYWLGMFFQGIWFTGQILFPFVLAKSLAAPGWLVTLSVLMETTGMVAGLHWGGLMHGGRRRRTLLWGGLVGRLVLVAALLIHTPGPFVVMLAVVYLFGAIVYPAQNSILQENIRAERRGEVFGRGALVMHGTAAACSVVVGLLLERDPMAYRFIYPVLGLLGPGFPLLMATVPRARGSEAATEPGPRRRRCGARWPRPCGNRSSMPAPPSAATAPTSGTSSISRCTASPSSCWCRWCRCILPAS